jgi:hypothetical protein
VTQPEPIPADQADTPRVEDTEPPETEVHEAPEPNDAPEAAVPETGEDDEERVAAIEAWTAAGAANRHEVVPGAKSQPDVDTSTEAEPPAAQTVASHAPVDAPQAHVKRTPRFPRLRRVDTEEVQARPAEPVAEPAPAPRGNGRRSPEWCTITLARNQRHGEFQVVILEGDGRRRVAQRSPAFRVPRSLQLRKRGDVRGAHAALVQELLASGWEPLEVRGRWHDTAFIRYPQDVQTESRALW